MEVSEISVKIKKLYYLCDMCTTCVISCTSKRVVVDEALKINSTEKNNG